MTVRVLLADDQALLRGTFRLLIDSCADMEVVGEAADGQEAVELARALRPDIVLMDIRMPGTDGLAATAAICEDRPVRSRRRCGRTVRDRLRVRRSDQIRQFRVREALADAVPAPVKRR